MRLTLLCTTPIENNNIRMNLMHCQETILDLGNGLGRVQVLGARLGAVQDTVASVQLEGIIQCLKTLFGKLITRVINPAEGLLKYSRSEVFLRVPPVAWARG